MTTEVGSDTEVKEKGEESAQPDQSEKAAEVNNAEGEEKEEKEKEKEKEGKGITRYLPGWLKKQKSQSQTSPTKEAPPPEETVTEATHKHDVQEVNGHAEEVEEKEDATLEQVEEKETESQSTASADSEPVKEVKEEKEVKAEDPAESPEEKPAAPEGEQEPRKEVEEEVKGGGGGGETQTSIFQSPLRLVRKTKMKMVICHVTLLDGTEYSCEVEESTASSVSECSTLAALSQHQKR